MDFDFLTSPNQNEANNNDQFGFSEPSKETNPSNNDGFQNMDFQNQSEQSQPKSTLDDMLNMNFQPMSDDSKPKDDMNLNMDLNINNKVDEEEQKRIADRKREADERKEKINQKIQKEMELRNEIIKKASEYMVEFEAKRQENIANRRKALEEKNAENNQNKESGNNSESWGRINSNIDLKDSEYKGSKDVQRMREAMLNRTNDSNSEPLQKFFG
jgi:hypothetical protein